MFKKLLKIIIFNCIVFLVAFFLAEGLTRIAFKNVDLLQVTGKTQLNNEENNWRVNDAFCAFRGTANYKYNKRGVNKTINKDGFISTPDVPVVKPPNTIRIVFLGESSTAGTGGEILSDEDTWPWVATEILKRNFPDKKIEFINASLGGFSSFESYGRLWARLRFYHPDIVVVYHGWNDMYYFNKKKIDAITNWSTNQPNGGWDIQKKFTAEIIKPFFLDNVLQYSQIFSHLRYIFAEKDFEVMGEKKTVLEKDFDPRGLNIWRDNLRLLKMTADWMQAKLLVCKPATLIVANLPEREQKRCRFDYHDFDYPAHLRAFQKLYEVIDEEIPPADIIDVTAASGKSDYFDDHIHPNKAGSNGIANIVANEISRFVNEIN
jgi:lysophospholipase L1-like esterase